MKTLNKTTLVVILIGLFNVIIHLLIINNLEYMRDELLYFSLGKHPAAGYATTPPLIALLSIVLQKTLGYSLFSVRLLPALGSGLIIYLASLITKEFGGKSFAQILTAVAMLVSPFLLRTFALYQPVFIDLFFWTLVFFLLVRYVNTNSPRYILFLGIAAGFSMLNKYLIAVLFLVILLVIALTSHRNVYKRKYLYLGFLSGLIIFLPNLIWQIVNGFPVINHMQELNETQLVHVNRIDFLIDQVMMPFLASLFSISGFIYLLTGKEMKKYRFIAVIVLLVVAILCLLRAKSYYTIGIFPVLIAAGSVLAERIIKYRFVQYVIILLLILMTLPIIPMMIPVYKADGLVNYFSGMEKKTGLTIGRRFEDGSIHSLPQDYADMIGWEELTSVTSKAWQKIKNKNSALIYCENYGQAGAISIIGEKYGLPEPVCFNDAFKKWIPVDLKTEIEEFIYINDELGEDISELFESIELIGSITNKNARECGTSVYLCTKPRTSFNQFWKERLSLLD